MVIKNKITAPGIIPAEVTRANSVKNNGDGGVPQIINIPNIHTVALSGIRSNRPLTAATDLVR